jgi:hypothetical protein
MKFQEFTISASLRFQKGSKIFPEIPDQAQLLSATVNVRKRAVTVETHSCTLTVANAQSGWNFKP